MATQSLPVLSRVDTIPPIMRLSPRQRRLLAALAEGKTLEQAGKEVGMSRQNAWHCLQSIRGRCADLMDMEGMSEISLLKKHLLPALEAEETEFAKFEGKITDERNVTAWGPRLQALELAMRVRGMFAPPKMAIRAHSDAFDLELEVVGGQ